MERETSYTCNDYRAEMILLGLKRRLGQELDLSEEEKETLIREINRLEKSLKIN
jgi:hypothetical protein